MSNKKLFKINLYASGQFLTQTPAEWSTDDYIPEDGELVFSRELTDIRAKLGNGIDTWHGLPFWSTSPETTHRNITTITVTDMSEGGTVYINGDWAGLSYRVFNQNANRFLYNGIEGIEGEIKIDPAGGFTLINGFRVYDLQELIVIF